MQSKAVRCRFVGPIVGLALLLGACAYGHRAGDATGGEDEIYPTNYKADILAAMHVYLNDPTAIRDAGISDLALKPVGNAKRYAACVRYNAKTRLDAKRGGTDYAGVKEIAAIFVSGRFDRFVDPAREACTGATYAPFPELGKLSR